MDSFVYLASLPADCPVDRDDSGNFDAPASHDDPTTSAVIISVEKNIQWPKKGRKGFALSDDHAADHLTTKRRRNKDNPDIVGGRKDMRLRPTNRLRYRDVGPINSLLDFFLYITLNLIFE